MGGRERPQQIITDPYSEYEPVNCRNYKHPRTSHGGFASVRSTQWLVCSSICSSLVYTLFTSHAMAPSFVLKPLAEQAVVLEDQREMARCGICSENYSAERKGLKCSAGGMLDACQYPACVGCWMRIEDGVCPQCRRPALPYFDRQLTDG